MRPHRSFTMTMEQTIAYRNMLQFLMQLKLIPWQTPYGKLDHRKSYFEVDL